MFVPGDLIIQRHQRGADPRRVISLTDNPDVVIVFDSNDQKYKRVFVSGHDLVADATADTREEASDHVFSETYIRTTSQPQW
jgi:hypothetical protein